MTSRVPDGEWEQLTQHQTYLLHLGRAMFFLAFLSILPAIWGKPIKMPAGVTFMIFAMWVFNARGLAKRIADLIAARDMKRLARSAGSGLLMHVNAGDEIRFDEGRIVRFHMSGQIETLK